MLADALDGGDELELGDRVHGVDQIDALDAIQVALVDAVDADEAGQTVGLRGAALADGALHRMRLLRHGTPRALIAGSAAQVVQMRHRDASQPLIAGIAKQSAGALGEFAGGRAGEIAVQGVEFGQRLLVGHAIAIGERLGRRPTTIAQMVLGTQLLDQPFHLCRRVAGDLGKEAQQESSLATPAMGIMELT